MKKFKFLGLLLVVFLIVFGVSNAFYPEESEFLQDCNDYDWTMLWYGDRASSTWRICPGSMAFEMTATTAEFLYCYTELVVVQGSNQFEVTTWEPDESYALIHFDGNFDGCTEIKQGVKVTGWIGQFPSWFDIYSPFRIYYEDGYIDIDGLPVPTTTSAITNHMMTKNPNEGSGCEDTIPNYTFVPSDDSAYCWLMLENVMEGDIIRWEWYWEDSLYSEGSFRMSSSGNKCAWSSIYIETVVLEDLFGNWRIDVFYNSTYQFTEDFEIVSSIPSGPCMLSLLYGEHSTETELLRSLRDNVLSKTQEGRALIKLYYLWSPFITRAMKQDEDFKQEVKDMVDGVLPMLSQ